MYSNSGGVVGKSFAANFSAPCFFFAPLCVEIVNQICAQWNDASMVKIVCTVFIAKYQSFNMHACKYCRVSLKRKKTLINFAVTLRIYCFC